MLSQALIKPPLIEEEKHKKTLISINLEKMF